MFIFPLRLQELASKKEASANVTSARANASAQLRGLNAKLAADLAAHPGISAAKEIWGRTLSEGTASGSLNAAAATAVHQPLATPRQRPAPHQQPLATPHQSPAPQPYQWSPQSVMPPQSQRPDPSQAWPQQSMPFFNAPPMSPYMMATAPTTYMPYMPLPVPYMPMPYMHGPPPPYYPPPFHPTYPPAWGMSHPYSNAHYGNPYGTAPHQPVTSEPQQAGTGAIPVPPATNSAPEHPRAMPSKLGAEDNIGGSSEATSTPGVPQVTQPPTVSSPPEALSSLQKPSEVAPSLSALPLSSGGINNNSIGAAPASPRDNNRAPQSLTARLHPHLHHDNVKLSPRTTAGVSSPRQLSDGGPLSTISSSASRYAPTDVLGTPLRSFMPIGPSVSGGGAGAVVSTHIPGSGSRLSSLSGVPLLEGSRGGGALSPSVSARGSRGGTEVVTSIKVMPSRGEEGSRGGGAASPATSVGGSRGGALADAIRALPSDGFRMGGGVLSSSASSGGSRGGIDPLSTEGDAPQPPVRESAPTTAPMKNDVSDSGAEEKAEQHRSGIMSPSTANEEISHPALMSLSPASSPNAAARGLKGKMGSNGGLPPLSGDNQTSPRG